MVVVYLKGPKGNIQEAVCNSCQDNVARKSPFCKLLIDCKITGAANLPKQVAGASFKFMSAWQERRTCNDSEGSPPDQLKLANDMLCRLSLRPNCGELRVHDNHFILMALGPKDLGANPREEHESCLGLGKFYMRYDY